MGLYYLDRLYVSFFNFSDSRLLFSVFPHHRRGRVREIEMLHTSTMVMEGVIKL